MFRLGKHPWTAPTPRTALIKACSPLTEEAISLLSSNSACASSSSSGRGVSLSILLAISRACSGQPEQLQQPCRPAPCAGSSPRSAPSSLGARRFTPARFARMLTTSTPNTVSCSAPFLPHQQLGNVYCCTPLQSERRGRLCLALGGGWGCKPCLGSHIPPPGRHWHPIQGGRAGGRRVTLPLQSSAHLVH